MRLFVALDLAPEIRQRMATLIEGLRGFAPDVRWVSVASLHLTLKFIGESDQLASIREILNSIHAPAVELAFLGAGFFPTLRSPRVFWIGVEADDRLAALARSIDEALAPLGIAKEAHAFTPHITLARSGSDRPQHKSSQRHSPQRQSDDAPGSRFALLQKRLAAMPPPDLGTMTAREFFLYQSKTAPTGAVYTKLAHFGLTD
jgi:2'-5' RNA ligase